MGHYRFDGKTITSAIIDQLLGWAAWYYEPKEKIDDGPTKLQAWGLATEYKRKESTPLLKLVVKMTVPGKDSKDSLRIARPRFPGCRYPRYPGGQDDSNLTGDADASLLWRPALFIGFEQNEITPVKDWSGPNYRWRYFQVEETCNPVHPSMNFHRKRNQNTEWMKL